MAEEINFGSKLRELRKKAGFSLRELASKIDVNFSYLSKIESGTLPPPSEKVILLLAKELHTDKDELLTLAGRIPADISELLRDQKWIRKLRAERVKKMKQRQSNEFLQLLPKHLYRLAVPVLLVIVVATTLWFAGPTQQAKALEVTFPSLPSSGTLGSSYTFTVQVSIGDAELLPLQQVDLTIYKASDPTRKATLEDLPKNDSSTATHNPVEGTTSGTATVAAAADDTWDYYNGTGYALWGGQGYAFVPTTNFGYGYSSGLIGTTSITYTVVWTPPSSWPTGNYVVETKLTTSTQNPGSGTNFIESSSTFSLSAADEGSSGGVGVSTTSGTTYIYDVISDDGVFKTFVSATSDDDKVTLEITRGVIGKTKEGAPLNRININKMDPSNAPPAPEGDEIIGLPYDFGPDGATFDPEITITFDIPNGYTEGMTIAYYSDSTGEWIPINNVVIDVASGKISGTIGHFTTFAIISVTEPTPTEPTPTEPTPTEPTPTEPTPTEPTPTEPTTNWWLWGAIIAAVVIVALVVLVIIRRRHN
jgi:transcriptional regulator with XRE-family HTH domain